MSSWTPNLKAFLTRVRYLGRTMPTVLLQRSLQAATMNAYSTAVLRTPVLTGYLRLNWQVTQGFIPGGTIGGVRDPQKSYPPRPVSEVVGQQNPFQITYISNFVRYAEAQNDGLGSGARTAWRMLEFARDAARKSLSRGAVTATVGGTVREGYGP